ncbi:hypothetical protein Scep_014432 [Stephania cephalantha]|uniref:Uncharacterized protein n=1 Tax=Stephania cephalantha TaxID=152367 RepID=A0AAP0J174_9MAGN
MAESADDGSRRNERSERKAMRHITPARSAVIARKQQQGAARSGGRAVRRRGRRTGQPCARGGARALAHAGEQQAAPRGNDGMERVGSASDGARARRRDATR